MDPKDELRRLQECLLVVQAQQHNSAAFGELVDLYERRLLYYLHRIVGEGQTALDLLQDVTDLQQQVADLSRRLTPKAE